MIDPSRPTRKRPGREKRLLLRCAVLPAVKASPSPILSTLNNIRSQGVSFDIPTKRIEMSVILNRKRLEPSLIHVPAAGAAPMSMPALRVRQRQPACEFGQLTVFPRPNDQAPMISQHAIRQQSSSCALDSLFQDTLEGFIVPLFLEEGHPRIRPVENVINQPAIGGSLRPSHPQTVPI